MEVKDLSQSQALEEDRDMAYHAKSQNMGAPREQDQSSKWIATGKGLSWRPGQSTKAKDTGK